MTSRFRIQAVLAQTPNEKLPGYKAAARAGMTSRQFNRRVAYLVKQGHISRERPTDGECRTYHYYLNAEQLDAFKNRGARRERAALSNKKLGDVILPTDTDDLPDRMKFLRMLKEKTVFAEHAALDLIINDYERTLKLRKAFEANVEAEGKQSRRRSV